MFRQPVNDSGHLPETGGGCRRQGTEQIKDLYLAELRVRGLKIPADDLPDAVADSIMGDNLPPTRLLAMSATEIAKLVSGMARSHR